MNGPDKSIELDEATPYLRDLDGNLRDYAGQQVGAALLHLVKDHLIERNARGNKDGFPRTNWYSSAAEGAYMGVIREGSRQDVRVSIAQVGFTLRYFGGTVFPGKNVSSFTGKPTKALTIAVNSKSYGHRAGEFGKLQFIPATKGSGAGIGYLFEPGRKGKKGSGALGQMLYVLVAKADIGEDKTLLPTDAEFTETALGALSQAVTDIARQK